MPESRVATESIPRLATPADGTNGSNLLYTSVQSVAGLIVPLLPLRLVRPVLLGRLGTFAQGGIVFGFTAAWLFLLTLQFAVFAILGFPPFQDPPKLDPLTWAVAGKAVLRGVLGVLQ